MNFTIHQYSSNIISSYVPEQPRNLEIKHYLEGRKKYTSFLYPATPDEYIRDMTVLVSLCKNDTSYLHHDVFFEFLAGFVAAVLEKNVHEEQQWHKATQLITECIQDIDYFFLQNFFTTGFQSWLETERREDAMSIRILHKCVLLTAQSTHIKEDILSCHIFKTLWIENAHVTDPHNLLELFQSLHEFRTETIYTRSSDISWMTKTTDSEKSILVKIFCSASPTWQVKFLKTLLETDDPKHLQITQYFLQQKTCWDISTIHTLLDTPTLSTHLFFTGYSNIQQRIQWSTSLSLSPEKFEIFCTLASHLELERRIAITPHFLQDIDNEEMMTIAYYLMLPDVEQWNEKYIEKVIQTRAIKNCALELTKKHQEPHTLCKWLNNLPASVFFLCSQFSMHHLPGKVFTTSVISFLQHTNNARMEMIAAHFIANKGMWTQQEMQDILSTPACIDHPYNIQTYSDEQIEQRINNTSYAQLFIFSQLSSHLSHGIQLKLLPVFLRKYDNSRMKDLAHALLPRSIISTTTLRKILHQPLFASCQSLQTIKELIDILQAANKAKTRDAYREIQYLLFQYILDKKPASSHLVLAQKSFPSALTIDEVVSVLNSLIPYASSLYLRSDLKTLLNNMSSVQISDTVNTHIIRHLPEFKKIIDKYIRTLTNYEAIPANCKLIENIQEILSTCNTKWHKQKKHFVQSLQISSRQKNFDQKVLNQSLTQEYNEFLSEHALQKIKYRKISTLKHESYDLLSECLPTQITSANTCRYILQQPIFVGCQDLDRMELVIRKLISANCAPRTTEYQKIQYHILHFILRKTSTKQHLHLATQTIPAASTLQEIAEILQLLARLTRKNTNLSLQDFIVEFQNIQISHPLSHPSTQHQHVICKSIEALFSSKYVTKKTPFIKTLLKIFDIYDIENSLSKQLEKLYISN